MVESTRVVRRFILASVETFWAKVLAKTVKEHPADLEKAKDRASRWSNPTDDDWRTVVLGEFIATCRDAPKDVAGAVGNAAYRRGFQADYYDNRRALYQDSQFDIDLTGVPLEEASDDTTSAPLLPIMRSLGLTNISADTAERQGEIHYDVKFEIPYQLLDTVAKHVIPT